MRLSRRPVGAGDNGAGSHLKALSGAVEPTHGSPGQPRRHSTKVLCRTSRDSRRTARHDVLTALAEAVTMRRSRPSRRLAARVRADGLDTRTPVDAAPTRTRGERRG